LSTVNWEKIEINEPDYFFVPKDFKNIQAYRKGVELNELFKKYKSGVESGRDDLLIDFQEAHLNKKIQKVLENIDSYKSEYKIKNTSSFRLKDSLEAASFNKSHVHSLKYKPFDNRFIYYDTNIQRRASYEVCG